MECYHVAMGETIQQSQLRNDNAAIMRRVAAGEAFTVTVNGREVADLVPRQRDSGKRRFVPVGEVAASMPALTESNARDWEHSVRHVDETLDDTLEDPFERARRNE